MKIENKFTNSKKVFPSLSSKICYTSCLLLKERETKEFFILNIRSLCFHLVFLLHNFFIAHVPSCTKVLTVFKRFFDGFTIEGIFLLKNKGKLRKKKMWKMFWIFFFVINFFVYKFFSSFLHSRVPLWARYVHIKEDTENMSD